MPTATPTRCSVCDAIDHHERDCLAAQLRALEDAADGLYPCERNLWKHAHLMALADELRGRIEELVHG